MAGQSRTCRNSKLMLGEVQLDIVIRNPFIFRIIYLIEGNEFAATSH
jgi:hypothetical protein